MLHKAAILVPLKEMKDSMLVPIATKAATYGSTLSTNASRSFKKVGAKLVLKQRHRMNH